MSTEYTQSPLSLSWFCLESQILLRTWGLLRAKPHLKSQWQHLTSLFLICTHPYIDTAAASCLHCVHPWDCRERCLMQDQLVVPVHVEHQWRSLFAFHCHLHISDLLRNQGCILSQGLQANNCVLKVERESLCCRANIWCTVRHYRENYTLHGPDSQSYTSKVYTTKCTGSRMTSEPWGWQSQALGNTSYTT